MNVHLTIPSLNEMSSCTHLALRFGVLQEVFYFTKLLTGAYNFGSSGEFMEMLKNSYFKEPGKVISGKIQFSSFRSLGKFGKFLNYL